MPTYINLQVASLCCSPRLNNASQKEARTKAHGAKVRNTSLGLFTLNCLHGEQYLSLTIHQDGPNKTATESLKSFVELNKFYDN